MNTTLKDTNNQIDPDLRNRVNELSQQKTVNAKLTMELNNAVEQVEALTDWRIKAEQDLIVLSNDNTTLRNEKAIHQDRIAKQGDEVATLRKAKAQLDNENVHVKQQNTEHMESINHLLVVEQKNVELNEQLQVNQQLNTARVAEVQDLRTSLHEQNLVAVENNMLANSMIANEQIRANVAVNDANVAVHHSQVMANSYMHAPFAGPSFVPPMHPLGLSASYIPPMPLATSVLPPVSTVPLTTSYIPGLSTYNGLTNVPMTNSVLEPAKTEE